MSPAATIAGNQLRIRVNLPAPVAATPRPDPKTLEIKLGDTVRAFRYWRTKWHNRKNRRVYSNYVLTWHDGLRPRREKRNTFKALRTRAQEIATHQENQQTTLLQLTPADQASFLRARELAGRVGAPIELLVSEAVEARLKSSRAKIVDKTCPQIVVELLAAKRAESAGKRWIDDLESRLDRFAAAFPVPLSAVASEEIRIWLTRLNLGKRSWNNNRTALLALFAFARERNYLAPDFNPLATIKPFRLAKPVEDIYTPEELRSLLFTAEKFYPQHLPTLAIMAFAGCRHCELQDAGAVLDWKDVHFKTRQIHVHELVAKSNTGRRYVPMQPNLVAWLEPSAKPRGPVCTVSNLTNAFARIAEKAGVTWKQNALRNSFISYRCAVTANIPQVASEAGNSVGETQKSYRRELTKEEGESWFNLWPTRAEILPLFAYARVEA